MMDEFTTKEEYDKAVMASYFLEDFINGIAESVNTTYIPTGFENLDEALDGGLCEGLYIIGGLPSLGKTTFALQMADQIAEQGNDVMIFSLEMSKFELMAKSISRLTVQVANEEKLSLRAAKTAREITDGKRYEKYTDKENSVILDALTQYKEFANHICICEGIGDFDVMKIRRVIDEYISTTGNKPVVFVDYVQIISPYNVLATDKQNIDKAILELKRISRDFKIPVIGISSFNRASYKYPVNMESFKESGGLEYGSDVLIGLQFQGTGHEGFDVNRAKQQNPREIELVILKNRNGKAGTRMKYYYNPAYNYFEENISRRTNEIDFVSLFAGRKSCAYKARRK